MPTEAMRFLPKSELLSYEEIIRLVELFAQLGVHKLRLTGGEPFVRQDLIQLIHRIQTETNISDLFITSNAVLIEPHLNELKRLNIAGLNISLDTINRQRFREISKRDALDTVLKAIEKTLSLSIPLKLNFVVLPQTSAQDLIDFVDFFKAENLDIRFIEYMPFNERAEQHSFLSHSDIMATLKQQFGTLTPLEAAENATSQLYQSEKFQARIGTIAAFSRNFCGSCNRIRLTATGDLKTCLYGQVVHNLRDQIRDGASDEVLKTSIQKHVTNRHKDGFAAEAAASASPFVSMSKIGG
jgi:cyclic pyranopterin phosphate synthase